MGGEGGQERKKRLCEERKREVREGKGGEVEEDEREIHVSVKRH